MTQVFVLASLSAILLIFWMGYGMQTLLAWGTAFTEGRPILRPAVTTDATRSVRYEVEDIERRARERKTQAAR